MSKQVEFTQIDALQTRIRNIQSLLGSRSVHYSQPDNQSQHNLTTLEAYNKMQEYFNTKGLHQHQNLIDKLVAANQFIRQRQNVQGTSMNQNEKASIIIQQAPKIIQNIENLKEIQSMKRNIDFAPITEKNSKIEELTKLDSVVLSIQKECEQNSEELDKFLEMNNKVVQDINMRFLNIESKLGST